MRQRERERIKESHFFSLTQTVNKEDVFEVRLRVGVSAAETNNNPTDTATGSLSHASLTPQLLSKVKHLY